MEKQWICPRNDSTFYDESCCHSSLPIASNVEIIDASPLGPSLNRVTLCTIPAIHVCLSNISPILKTLHRQDLGHRLCTCCVQTNPKQIQEINCLPGKCNTFSGFVDFG